MRIALGEVRTALDSGFLNLIILPTEQCNFRCSYCYEDFSVGRMQPDTVSAVKNLISARAGELHTLVVSWFGGEPLLAPSIITEIGVHAQAAARTHGFEYESNITTNGSLLDAERLRQVVSAGVTSFQISLDGPRRQHDLTRRRASGVGTFAQIWENILGVRDSDFDVRVMVRVHVSPDNCDSLDELIDQLNEELRHDARFTIYFKTIDHLGGPNDKAFSVLDHDARRATLDRLGSKLANPSQCQTMEPGYVCYASMANSLMIRANGTVGKCTVALTDARNALGRIRPDGTLDLDQQKLRLWLHGLASLDEAELACPNETVMKRKTLPMIDTAVP